ncbi:hypothetical protein [Salinimicrobium marinum]|uniref:hypothetical protein n=1 Tax=Salinimicrobium marinum TaxID=680283 RepID=UPI00167A07C0|nr:hypothetical protein [Salinimicrobium marinum]
MKKKLNYIGFCFAILLGILNISGGLAEEKPLFISSEEDTSSIENLQPSGDTPFWAAEELLTKTSLPEYSEEQFSSGNSIIPAISAPSEEIYEPKSSALPLNRDLRAEIRIQLFPFHFFL